MTAFALLAASLLLPAAGFAAGESPVTQGLGGAGRAGLPREASFSNPASAALLTGASSYFFYQKPSVPDWDAGGRVIGMGASDGETSALKGAFSYLRTSRARMDGLRQAYEDRKEYRFTAGLPLSQQVMGGLQARYVTRRIAGGEEKFFDGDVGAIFPVYAGLSGGLTYENVLKKEGERAPTAGVGVGYLLAGIQLYLDGYRQMSGPMKGERGWAAAADMSLFGDFRVRAGRFQDGYRRIKGWSTGASWAGPRASFDYGLRITGSGPKEVDHTLGMSVGF